MLSLETRQHLQKEAVRLYQSLTEATPTWCDESHKNLHFMIDTITHEVSNRLSRREARITRVRGSDFNACPDREEGMVRRALYRLGALVKMEEELRDFCYTKHDRKYSGPTSPQEDRERRLISATESIGMYIQSRLHIYEATHRGRL